ncbi:MAG: hypothetical protein Ct9H300mP14_08340 [Gammaproteobacteria bacterium]|nr:MAG: hypothetical protein Ct9H300mP14_08340 [Gammaproteobacteria bacterium]
MITVIGLAQSFAMIPMAVLLLNIQIGLQRTGSGYAYWLFRDADGITHRRRTD